MITIKNYGFYTVYSNGKYPELCERLEFMLPHGSGINYDWYIEAYKYHGNIYLKASNHFDAMNDVGFYCHVYDFTAHYKYNLITEVKCQYCMNEYNSIPGYRSFDDLSRYNWTLQDFIDRLNPVNLYGGLYVKCLYCDNGISKIPEFELTNRRILYGRELKCCGYGLEDYLSQALYVHTH